MGLFERLLSKRGISSGILDPKYPEGLSGASEGVFDGGFERFFERLPDVRKACERLCQAADRGEKVLIYGDYDVDGVTASALMQEILVRIGVPAERIFVMLPDRFKDGYGMSKRCITRAKELAVGLVVTVDCGSSNGDIIAELAAAGIETVVTDHHAIITDLPPAVAVVNPQRGTDTDLQQLCGAGVAFMVAGELVRMGRIPEGQEKWLLDLAAIGTICDAMVLTGINRVICHYGMIVLAKTRRVGLIELLRTAGVQAPVTTEAVGFQIGPRLNAAGRMKSAEVALRLLTTTSRAEAVRLAGELEELNAERKKQQNAAVSEVEAVGIGDEPVIFACGKWHEGVLGIIAGRLVEQYKRPAFVLSEVSPGVYKGSGRSFGDFSLAQALSECQKYLEKCGGHAGACGLTVLEENLSEFRAAVQEFYKGLGLKNQEEFLEVQEDLTVEDLGEFTTDLVANLRKLEPYGEGNPEPVWRLPGVLVLDARAMGAEGQHLRLTVRDGGGQIMKLIAFYADAEWLSTPAGSRADVWITLTENEWQGKKGVEGRIVRLERMGL